MSITLEEVRDVAKLARLDLDESEMLSLQGELNALLGHFEDIRALDVHGVAPSAQPVALANVWAQDDPRQPLPRPQAMANAPSSKAGLFLVQAILEG